MAALSPEEEYYVRMSLLVTGVSPRAVRVVFDREFAPQVLQSTIRREYKKIMGLFKKNIINQSQSKALFPQRGVNVDSKSFDASLMICLIRNLTTFAVSDKLPAASDVSVGGDLSRIKYYRNDMAHLTDNKIDNTYFNTAWNNITGAIHRLGGPLLKEECNKLQYASLDQSNVEMMKEVQLSRQELAIARLEVDDLKDEIRQIKEEHEYGMDQTHSPYPFYESENIKDNYRKQIEKFVQTKTTDSIIKAITENQCVVITGPAACGKSVNAFYAAYQSKQSSLSFVSDIEGMSFLSTTREDKMYLYNIRSCSNWDQSQIFILDDLFGRCTFNQRQFSRWLHLCSEIKTSLWRIPGIKLIITCRQDIYENYIEGRLGIHNHHCAVHYSKDEIKQICNSYLNTDVNLSVDIPLHEVPALCYLAFINVRSWNESPLCIFEALNGELKQMRETDVWSYKAVILLCLLNNKLDIKIVRLTSHTHDRLLTELCCGLECRMSVIKENIERSLTSLTGTYIKMTKRKYESQKFADYSEIEFAFVNEWLFDHIATSVFNEYIDLSIEYADSVFIKEKMRVVSLASHCVSKNNLILNIPPEYKESYFKRLIKDLKNGYVWDALGSNGTLSPEYMKTLISFLQDENISGIKDNKDNSTILHVCSFLGYTDLVPTVIEMDQSPITAKNSQYQTPLYLASAVGFYHIVTRLLNNLEVIRTKWSEIKEPLKMACANCHINIVRKLLEYFEEMEIYDKHQFLPVDLACENGSTELLELLLNHNAPVNPIWSTTKPLHIAAFHGYTNIVKLLLKHSNVVDVEDSDGFTPLCIASSKGHHDVVTFLLKNFAAVNYNGLPLYAACEHGFYEITKMLLENNAVVDKEYFGYTPLGVACKEGHEKVVDVLLTFGADLENCSTLHKLSALHIACQYFNIGKANVVKLLLKKRANVNAVDIHGYTPLPYVLPYIGDPCHTLKGEIAELLIHNNASVNHPDNEGFTPLYTAIVNGQKYLAEFLMRNKAHLSDAGQKYSLLSELCSQGRPYIKNIDDHLAMIEMLLVKLKADLHVCDKDGFSPLTAACREGNRFCVELLVRHEANINRLDNNGKTPLYIACLKNHSPVVELLLHNKASINERCSDGSTPLHAACLPRDEKTLPFTEDGRYNSIDNYQYNMNKNQKDIIINLLQHGEEINRRDHENKTALYIACDTGDCGLVGLLLTKNPELDVKTSTEGLTPLHVACMKDKADIVACFLTHVADLKIFSSLDFSDVHLSSNCSNDGTEGMSVINEVDNNGRTPLHNVSQYGYVDIVDILLRNGAAINRLDRQNCTPLFTACQNNHIRVVQRLIYYGAKVNQECIKKLTPLHIACAKGNVDVVALLLRNGAETKLVDEKGFRPLNIASEHEHFNIVQLLSKHHPHGNTSLSGDC